VLEEEKRRLTLVESSTTQGAAKRPVSARE
jgi:hypothetical protein